MNNFERMREKEKKLSFEEAKKRFQYDPETGELIRIFSRNTFYIGKGLVLFAQQQGI